jgi:hypothetical protein
MWRKGCCTRANWAGSAKRIAAAAAIALVICGCPSDAHMREDITCHNLIELRDIISAFVDLNPGLDFSTTCLEPRVLLRRAESLGLCAEGDLERYEFDAWSRPYLWSARINPHGATEVAVISKGENGVFEDGRGDDLVLRIGVAGNRARTVELKCR